MDRELRDKFEIVFEKIDKTRDSMETKIESLRNEVIIQGQAAIKTAEAAKTTRSKVEDHLADHKERRKWWLGILAALMLQGFLGLWAWFKMHVNGK